MWALTVSLWFGQVSWPLPVVIFSTVNEANRGLTWWVWLYQTGGTNGSERSLLASTQATHPWPIHSSALLLLHPTTCSPSIDGLSLCFIEQRLGENALKEFPFHHTLCPPSSMWALLPTTPCLRGWAVCHHSPIPTALPLPSFLDFPVTFSWSFFYLIF